MSGPDEVRADTAAVRCPRCNASVDDQMAQCWMCGYRREPAEGVTWLCVVCQTAGEPGRLRCPHCGAMREGEPRPVLFPTRSASARPKKGPRWLRGLRLSYADFSRRASTGVGFSRRFSLGRLMIVVVLFAVVFAVMQSLDTPPTMFGAIATFLFAIAMAQALLFEGRRPRAASFLAGIVLAPVISCAAMAVTSTSNPRFDADHSGMVCLAIAALIFGGPAGYLAGGLIAGVFLQPDQVGADAPQG